MSPLLYRQPFFFLLNGQCHCIMVGMEQKHTNPNMKKIGLTVSILMGITLSFFLSLVGISSSGHFTVMGWLSSFAISLVVSLCISFVIPMKKLTDAIHAKLHLNPRKIGTLCLDSFVSDVIYTPLITFVMVAFAYAQAKSHGAVMPFLPMFLHSLLLCFVVGYILIFICQPLYIRFAMKKAGIHME